MQPQNMNKPKVIIYFLNNFILQGPANPRYKTSLCKKFTTEQGCPYGDKCQFAHGAQELRLYNGPSASQNMLNMNKSQNSLINYKIVRCKNWEQDKTCKYGVHCTFAHGDNELRNKADNIYQFNPNMQFMYPMIMPAGMDFNQMQQMMANGPLMMGMNMNNMNPNMGQEQGNEPQNNNEN